MKKNKVMVLLSTYNGEKYLKELLDSVINQKQVETSIMIRDDGSNDNTIKIIEDYQKRYSNIKLIKGKNLGYAKSFLELIKLAEDADYYALCDQDDIWDESKLFSAINMMEEYDDSQPLLYTSNVIPVNNNLEKLEFNLFTENRVLNNYECFQKSILPGCTFVFNKNAKDKISYFNGYCESHDWAIYCICKTFGKVIFDENSYILYRLHGNNTIGQSSDKISNYIGKIKNFFKKSKKTRSKFAMDFYNSYRNEIPKEYLTNIYQLAFYRESIILKLRLLFNKNYKGIIFKLYILLNRV